ncbi:MAG: LacI family DNA-binding transcriptional regulator [Armatimonadetes bacterium]|nr:LacI family DNA-binding transcriptional regulator [Armatimonadota bacterium]MBS1710185.1 LacI family DNA-binding transcriptional regulator [Armatimonadota bacterium]MBX3110075.1 LacI family DNA-binding transcriptional regulator [Fimbriimonadaceae bacterium]
MRKPTIADVAKLAGVGKVTVSYVLNGQAETARISKPTADRVERAAAQLNYRPNAHARNLVRQRADTIGVVFQYADYFSSASSFITEVLKAVCQACTEAGVDVLLHTKPTTDPMAEANALSDGCVDAVIMIRDENDPVHEILLEREFPTVLFFCRSDDPRASFVCCDNYAGGRLAVSRFAHSGHQRIAMLMGGPRSVDASDRYHGYCSALKSAGLEFRPEFAVPEGRVPELLPHLMRRDDHPTAVFAWSDDCAMECIRCLQQLGFRVPEDVEVIGFDGTEAGARFSPPLSSIRQPIQDIAATAVQAAKDLVEENAPRRVILPPTLVERSTTRMQSHLHSNNSDPEVPFK